MTYEESLGVLLGTIILASFVLWYLWCLYVMFFIAPNLKSYFSYTYESSGPFVAVNALMFVLGAAWILMKLSGG